MKILFSNYHDNKLTCIGDNGAYFKLNRNSEKMTYSYLHYVFVYNIINTGELILL